MSYLNAPAAPPFSNLPQLNRTLFQAKQARDLTFEQIAKHLGRDEVWTAALFYGQAKPTQKDLEALADVLQLDAGVLSTDMGGQWMPSRGHLFPMPPTDPTIYRLYEGLLVYGYPIKDIIHEKFGDGIMSLIDCKVHVDKKEDPKGDRVLLTFDGKFLPYQPW